MIINYYISTATIYLDVITNFKEGDMLNNITLKLHEYLTDGCPHKGCKYNDSSACTCEDPDHLQNIIDNIDSSPNEKTSALFDKSFVCYAVSIREGQCACGSDLVEFTDNVPYGETNININRYHCPNCDK